MKHLVALIFVASFLLSCDKDDDKGTPSDPPAPLPVACFTADAYESLDHTHVFSFNNCSQNAFRSEWDFGDFTYAPVANPFHVYNQQGEFIVRLTVYNADGVSSTIADTITIGNYMLDKIIYYQVWAGFPMPVTVSIGSAGFPYVGDVVPNQGALPITVDLPDNVIYSFTSPLIYGYREIDSAGVTHNGVFTVNEADIVNKMYNANIPFLQHDTAKFIMYYKIIF